MSVNLPEHVVLSALGLTADELAAAVESGDIERPIEHPAGFYQWSRRAVTAYRANHSKPLPAPLPRSENPQ